LLNEGGTEVCQQQSGASNTEQLDAANNNARLKSASHRYADAENNNMESQLSSQVHSHSVDSSMSREPGLPNQNCADDGIQIMPYTDFVRSRMAHGLPPPRGVVVRRDGRHVLVPQYVVQHHRQHKARVRSLRRHGYESEDGRVAGRHYDSDQCHSNASRHRHRRAAQGHGYDSDLGYRSDLAGYNSSRPGTHRTGGYPNSAIYASDFGTEDLHYGSDRDVHRLKAPRSSTLIARPGHNIPLYERNVQETITEEVMECEGQPHEQSHIVQGQEWPSSGHVHSRNHFTNQYGVSQSIVHPHEAENRRNKLSSRRRNFEPIEL